LAEDVSRWVIEFKGCTEESPECYAGLFGVASVGAGALSVEVRVTGQIESLLARQLGRPSLTTKEREAILSVAGRHLIEECLSREGKVDPVFLLTSQIFMSHGAERRLLRECELL
jgi:hypothetical protein